MSNEDEPIIETAVEPLQQYLKEQAAIESPTHPAKLSPGNTLRPPVAFRPLRRQPLATLTILDDGAREGGETIRVRDSRLTIGREKCDITIAFDNDMSGRHAELRCRQRDGKYEWVLLDCKSTNGTFVRGARASLFRDTELILGSRRYQFQLPSAAPSLAETQALQTQHYQAPGRNVMEELVPGLTEVGVEEDSNPHLIGEDNVMLGRDPGCQIHIANDPFLNHRHARFYRDERQRWMIEDQRSLNGVWIRAKKLVLRKQTEFQLGQQRFRFLPEVAPQTD